MRNIINTIVRTSNKFNRLVSLLGSQYTYNVGFEFPTLGDSNLETQQYFYNLCIAFLSLFVAINLDSRLSFQTFNNPLLFLSLILQSKISGKIMITLKASGNGGPILLSLSGCLVGSMVWCEWHWNQFLLQGRDDVRRRNLSRRCRASRIWPSRALTCVGDGMRLATN